MSRKLWQVNRPDKALAAELAEKERLFPFAALIAQARGIKTSSEARAFFYDEEEDVPPLSFTDMDKAVRVITDAIDGYKRIAVCGDYDADGVTATALLYTYLQDQGADVISRIPERSEGYGLSIAAIDELHEQGVKLIVTVDCGISCIDEAEYCRKKGIKLVVTDHHLCGDRLPDCEAVVDPHREDCRIPFRDYAGVGVAYKLVCAMEGENAPVALETFADLITLGTVGDVMPLLGENRRIVRRGLRQINDDERPGLNALREVSGTSSKDLKATDLSFGLVPRINAAGRMGSPLRAFNLLISEDFTQCADLAGEINHANVLRHEAEEKILKDIGELLKNDPLLKYDKVIVVDGEGWHGGVIGIVAAKLVERFGKPAIVISRDGENAKGSGRSIEGFSLYDALKSCEDCLERYGGHKLAAGLGLRSGTIERFRREINKTAAELPTVRPMLKIDCRLSPAAINNELLNALATLEPFGAGNPLPTFGLFGVTVKSIQPVSEGRHTKLILDKNGVSFAAMRFGLRTQDFPFKAGEKIDVAVTVEANEYLGTVSPSIRIKDLKPSGTLDEAVFSGMELFDKIMRNEELTREEKSKAYPDRDFMLSVYKLIRNDGGGILDAELLCARMNDDGSNWTKVAVSVEAMTELGVLNRADNGRLSLPAIASKADLTSSRLLARLR